MYQIQLTDSVNSQILPKLNIPLTETPIEGATDVTTLDLNIYTDFFAKKRSWQHTWAYLTEDEFNILKGFYDRQFTLWQYPEITISELGINNIPVRMTLSPRNIIDNCGTVQDVEVSFRESVQMSDNWESS